MSRLSCITQLSLREFYTFLRQLGSKDISSLKFSRALSLSLSPRSSQCVYLCHCLALSIPLSSNMQHRQLSRDSHEDVGSSSVLTGSDIAVISSFCICQWPVGPCSIVLLLLLMLGLRNPKVVDFSLLINRDIQDRCRTCYDFGTDCISRQLELPVCNSRFDPGRAMLVIILGQWERPET